MSRGTDDDASDEEAAYALQEGESITDNALFRELKRNPDMLGVAAVPGTVFAAPRSSTLPDVDRATIAAHILQPKGDGCTFYTMDGRVVRVDRGKFLVSVTGFDRPRRVRILGEESFYSDDQQIQAMLLDSALVGDRRPPPRPPRLWTQIECTEFIRSLPGGSMHLDRLMDRVSEASGYLDAPSSPQSERDFEVRLASILRTLAAEAAESLLRAPDIAQRARTQRHLPAAVTHALENLAVARCHARIMALLLPRHAAADAAVRRFALSAAPAQLLSFELPAAACERIQHEWHRAERAAAPSEQLLHIRRAVRRASRYATGSIGADELVPLVCYLLAVAQSHRAATHARFLQHFLPQSTGASQSAYLVSTLAAAVQHAVSAAPPVPEENPAVAALLAAGIAVDARMAARLAGMQPRTELSAVAATAATVTVAPAAAVGAVPGAVSGAGASTDSAPGDAVTLRMRRPSRSATISELGGARPRLPTPGTITMVGSDATAARDTPAAVSAPVSASAAHFDGGAAAAGSARAAVAVAMASVSVAAEGEPGRQGGSVVRTPAGRAHPLASPLAPLPSVDGSEGGVSPAAPSEAATAAAPAAAAAAGSRVTPASASDPVSATPSPASDASDGSLRVVSGRRARVATISDL